jgi:hypothetical protein
MNVTIQNFNNKKDEYSQFQQQINSLKQKFPSVLEDFKKAYISYKSNPTTLTNYNENTQKIKDIFSQIFIIDNNIQKEEENINKVISQLNASMKTYKSSNYYLEKKYQNISGVIHGSNIMSSDYNKMYYDDFLNNLIMIIGCIVVFLIILSILFPSIAKKTKPEFQTKTVYKYPYGFKSLFSKIYPTYNTGYPNYIRRYI